MSDKPYGKGIKFKCIPGCARCCRGEGYVYVSNKEASEIANYLNITLEEFLGKYTKFNDKGKRILIDKHDKVQCIFLRDDYKCAIYEVRPIQCKTYPFWTSIFKDKGSLNYEKLHCPGFGTGKFYSKEEIEAKLYDIHE